VGAALPLWARELRGCDTRQWCRSARHRIACQWADLLLEGAPSAAALIGLEDGAANVIELRRTA
jgi:hypothetical protein